MQSNMGKGEESSMTEKIESIESGTPLPRPKDRFVGHLKRFWWIYFAIFVILALIIVLPIIYVGYPHKAQKDVNNSELEITALSLTSPTSNSVVLQQVSTLHSNSSFNPQLDAFNASLFLQGTEPNIKPFAFVNIPSVHSTGAAPVDFKQSLQLVDVDQFTDFAKLALSSEDFVFGINGRTGLHQSGLPKTTVTYSGFPKMKGLNGLKGFNITTFKISLTPNPDGSNLIGTVYVPNTSVMTLDLGNVTLRLSITGTPIGTALIPDLTLKPGNNTLDMRATTNTSVVLSKLGAFPSGVVPVDIVGSDCIYNGQHLTYYEEALKANPQKIGLNLTAAIASAGN